MDFITQFKAARRVSTPIVAIRTFDAKSTVDALKGALNGKLEETPLILWDSVHGMRAVTKVGGNVLAAILAGDDPASTVPFVEALRKSESCGDDDAILVFANSHLAWSEPVAIQAVWNLRDSFTANGNMLVLLCSPGAVVPSELVNDVLVLDEPLPTSEQLEAIVADEFKFSKSGTPESDVLNKATDALIGLPAFASKQSTAMCLNNGKLDISELWERKRQVIAQTPGCSVYKGEETLNDVRGLDAVVSFLRKRMSGKNPPKALLFQDEVEKAFAGTGTDMSGVKTELTGSYCTWFEQEKAEGITFIGLPGVSKSALAKALGNEYGLPVIIFDIAATQSSLVGSSGANLRAAQKMISSISQGRLLVISTCNGIDQVPPEIRRRIGSLGIFFFDAPSAQEQTPIWDLYRTKYAISKAYKTPACSGWTGAEIKECCRKADIFGMTLEEAAQYIVPVTRSSSERIQSLRASSSGKYLSASKPGVYTYAESTQTVSVPMVTDGRKVRD